MKLLNKLGGIIAFGTLALLVSSCSDENVTGQLNIHGNVSDTDGNAIAGAVVTVRNVDEAQLSPRATTNENGDYSMSNEKCTTEVLVEVDAEGYESDAVVLQIEYNEPIVDVTLGTADVEYDFTLTKSWN